MVIPRNKRIEWIYSVSGAKLRKTVYTNGSVTLTQDYVSGYVYKNNQLDFFFMEQGRVKKLVSGRLRYEYDIKDHLGNTRVSFADTNSDGNADILQEDHYYAFGLRIEGLSSQSKDNKFTYNGKELEDDHGLNWYHYGARYYDPALGRWHTVDPIDELYSPYNYVGNNPIIYTDPDGRGIEDGDPSPASKEQIVSTINQSLKDEYNGVDGLYSFMKRVSNGGDININGPILLEAMKETGINLNKENIGNKLSNIENISLVGSKLSIKSTSQFSIGKFGFGINISENVQADVTVSKKDITLSNVAGIKYSTFEWGKKTYDIGKAQFDNWDSGNGPTGVRTLISIWNKEGVQIGDKYQWFNNFYKGELK